MKIVKQSFAFFLVFVMLVCACPVSISAASTNGEITVGNASGYPGDIVGVKVSMTKLPSGGFSFGTFDVVFGENLQFVNLDYSVSTHKPKTFTRPDDVSDNSFVVFYEESTEGNFETTDDLFVVYFRIKSSASPEDNGTYKNTISVISNGYSFLEAPVQFDCVSGAVELGVRNSALGEVLEGHSITLDGAVSMNFHVSVPDSIIADDSAKIVFTINGDEEIKVEEKLSNCEIDNLGNVILSCSLPAPMWSRTVTAQIVTATGCGDEYSYSVKNYAVYLLSGAYSTGDDEKDNLLKNLCVALLNYGGYAQRYLDYFTSDLSNSNVFFGNSLKITNLINSSVDDSIVDTSASFSGNASGITYLGTDVAVDSATAIRHYFSVEGNVEDYKFYILEGETVVEELKPSVIGGEVAVTISNIPAAYLDKPYTLKVMKNDSNVSVTVKYSVKTYMASIINSDSADADLKNLARAMYLYSEAANAFFTSEE